MVASAGNKGAAASEFSPGSSEDALTVGAADNKRKRLPFSNHGTSVDVHAPGDLTSSTDLDVENRDNLRDRRLDLTGWLQGTSVSAAMVSGLVAYLRSVDPTLRTPAQVKAKVLELAYYVDGDDDGLKKPFIWNGFGLPAHAEPSIRER